MLYLHGLHTAESVSNGHPDKICDQVSDAILDACLAQDPRARVAVECAIKGDLMVLMGEITTTAQVDHAAVARGVLRDIGHDGRWGIDPDRVQIITRISEQAPEIASGVDREELGAGDQGLVFGYACDDTPEFLPLAVVLANRLMRAHAALRREEPLLGPDAKAQITVDHQPGGSTRLLTVVLSSQHAPELSLSSLRELLHERLLRPVLGKHLRPETVVLINPAGSFHLGGPVADAGLTGRKIIVDSYGGYGLHGGGAFSGKDGTKIDRSAAYAARQLARDVVARGWAHACEVRLAYAIGQAEPVAIDFRHDGEHHTSLEQRYEAIGIDLPALMKPGAIIDRLGLDRPIFRETAAFGHFGVAGRSWEQGLESAFINLEATKRLQEAEAEYKARPVIQFTINDNHDPSADQGRTAPEIDFPVATEDQLHDLARLRRLSLRSGRGLGLPNRLAWIHLRNKYPVCARVIAAEVEGAARHDALMAEQRLAAARKKQLENEP